MAMPVQAHPHWSLRPHTGDCAGYGSNVIARLSALPNRSFDKAQRPGTSATCGNFI